MIAGASLAILRRPAMTLASSPVRRRARCRQGARAMTYRTILIELAADKRVEARLRVTHALARRFDATLVGMHVVPSPLESAVAQGLAAACLGRETIEAVRRAELAARERARAVFRHVCGADPAAVLRAAEGDPAR